MEFSQALVKDTLLDVAARMLIAAKTAPKAKGCDNLFCSIVEGDGILRLSEKMIEIGNRCDVAFFNRDAKNILNAPVLVLFGTSIAPMGLKKCGMCGFDCGTKPQNTPCVFNTGDLGTAIGSAVGIAADNRVDNRIMYTVGQAAVELGMVPEDVKIVYGVPLCAGAKNPFFDRK